MIVTDVLTLTDRVEELRPKGDNAVLARAYCEGARREFKNYGSDGLYRQVARIIELLRWCRNKEIRDIRAQLKVALEEGIFV